MKYQMAVVFEPCYFMKMKWGGGKFHMYKTRFLLQNVKQSRFFTIFIFINLLPRLKSSIGGLGGIGGSPAFFGRIMEVILDAGSSLEVKSALLGGDDFAVDGWMVEGEIWKWIFFCP